jgi:putative CocE/NonD family hydrolase
MCAWFFWVGQPTATLQNFRRIDWLHLPLNQIGAEAGLDHPKATIQLEERGFPGSLSAEEITQRLQSIEVPSQIICAWYDEFLTENLLNYERQALGGGDVRLVIGPWHHNLEDQVEPRLGKVAIPEPPVNRYYAEMERFFGHYLKAGATAPLEAGGRVLLYVLGSNQWRYENEWPLSRAVMTPLYLSSGGNANTDRGDGALSWEPPADECADQYSYNPLDPIRSVEGVTIWNLFTDGQFGDRAAIESRQDVLVYSTPVLEHDIEVTGTINVVLHAASSAPDTDFILNLIDVYPDGHTQYLCNGIMRVTYRDGLDERKLIEPSRIYAYRFALRPISNCFQKGHRIRIEVTSSDMDRYARNQNVADAPGTTANVAIAEQTIHHGGAMLSRLELPVIPAL